MDTWQRFCNVLYHFEFMIDQTNERGQVTVKSSVLKQMEDLKEETGLTWEGYRYQPAKVPTHYIKQYNILQNLI